MYKGASQSLQRQHAVDKPHPSRGYIYGSSDASDILLPVDDMTLQEADDELRQLEIEMQRTAQALALARKTEGKRKGLGYKLATLTTRHKLVRRHIHDLKQKEPQGAKRYAALSEAVRRIVDNKTQFVIFNLAKEIAAQGIEAGTATTAGRGPKDESPVANGDAPKL